MQATRHFRLPAVLVLLSLTAASTAPATGPTGDDLARRVRERWAAESFDVQELVLPDGAPARLVARVEHEGRELDLVLERHSLRAPFFRLRVFADGVTREVQPPAPASYQGTVAGDPETLVAGTLTAAGLSVRVFPPAGQPSWAVRPLALVVPGAPRTRHVVLDGGDWPAGAMRCGVADDARPVAAAGSRCAVDRVAPGAAGADAPGPDAPQRFWCGASGMKKSQIAFDVDQVYYRDLGSDVAAVTANVEGHLAEVDAFYARDALITYELTDLIIRTTDFYLPQPTTGSLLDLFQAEWNTNQRGVIRDIAHLMTGQPAPGLAGLAYVGVTCNLDWCYGWSVDSSGVVGHELGHNWGAGHCHDLSPCNNMCGACLAIGPSTKDVIMAFRDGVTCLDDAAPYTPAVPPYAHPDALALGRAEAIARAAQPVDVLGNDHDANCDPLAILAVDPVSAFGGTVALDPGGGAGGRDRVIYTPPCQLFAGEDSFAYTVHDGTGGTSSTAIRVDVIDHAMAGSWPLDDGAGGAAADRTGWRRDGVVSGGATWVAGRRGGALELDGIDGYVALPPLDLDGDEATITAWVRRNGTGSPWSAFVFSRGGGTTAGLGVGDNHELRYTWSDDPATWGWDSGLVVPDAQWVFVAVTVTPGQAVVYLDDGTWRSATNTVAHAPQTFAAAVDLGRDPVSAARHFAGALDDVRVYGRALTEPELQAVRDGGGKADAPSPADGQVVTSPGVTLSWSPSAAATAHDLYLGEDVVAVAGATPASREYLGRFAAPPVTLPALLAGGVTHAWRVDEVGGGPPITGDTWLFTYRGAPGGLAGYWRLDETAGATAADATGGGHDGALSGGVTFVPGRFRNAASFDGASGVVAIPPLSVTGSEMTITAWIRPRGSQAAWAGLVFTRGTGAATGLNFNDQGMLGYHWADAYWWWSSGLSVPVDQWVFVALAVAPDRATLHVDDGAGLQSAVNVAGHGSQTLGASIAIGRDPWGALRSFAGEIDDVRIYSRALSPGEVAAVRDRGGPAERPVPAAGALLAASPAALAWVGGAAADAHDVYFGSDLAAVTAATRTSTEFRASQVAESWPLPLALAPAPGTTSYWRIDERTAAGVVRGAVWHFALVPDAGGSLRVVKTPAGEPRLTWAEVGANASYEVRRCEPPASGGPCTLATAAAIGPRLAEWVDAGAAGASLVWYDVVTRPCW